MADLKIDKTRLLQLKNQNKSNAFCAKEFGCTEHAITVAWRKIRHEAAKSKDIDVTKSELSRDNIDVLTQQKMLNTMLMDELKRCGDLIMHEERKARVRSKLEVAAARAPKNQHIAKALAVCSSPKVLDTLAIQKTLLANAVEMRKQGEFQFKVAEAMHNVMMVAEFQEAVLNVLKDAHPDLRDKVIKKMKEARQIRGLIKMQ